MKHLIDGMQEVSESYTDEYVASQRDMETMIISMRASKELIANFILYHQVYIKDLRQQKLWIDALEVKRQEMILFEIENVKR